MWKVGQLQAKLVVKNIAVRTEDCVQFHYKLYVKKYFITCTPLCSTRFALDDCSFHLPKFSAEKLSDDAVQRMPSALPIPS